MKKITVSLLFIFIATAMFAQKQFVVDANAQMRSLDKSFNEIKVSNGIDIYLSQSDKEAIAVSASDEKYITNIKTVVENNTLKIYYEGDRWWGKNRKMTVYVSFVNLEKINASGASDITVAGTIKTTSLKLILSGASDFKGDVAVTSLDMDLSGASDVKISGTATDLNIESSGASDVKGYDLKTEICTAKASGASDINVTVNKELNAHASGASSIYYQGTGVIKDVHANGASSVGKRGS
ncbi:MAG: head GIN domain-containing protein [Ferruginibacter sp.]